MILKTLRLACFALLLCFPWRGFSVDIPVSNFLTLSNAYVNTATTGDRILIDPVTILMTSRLVLTRPVSFDVVGAGTNLTKLVSTNITGVFAVQNNSAAIMTFSDMEWIGHAANTSGFLNTGVGAPSTRLPGLVRVTRITMRVGCFGMSLGSGDSPYLVDHCYFETPDGITVSWNSIRFYGNAYHSWLNNGNQLGTTNQGVVENCVFINLDSNSAGNGFFDGYNGGSVTARYNLFDGNANTGVHGYDSQITSFKSMEVYNNIFTNLNTVWMSSRGGVFLFYSNQAHSIYPSSQPANQLYPVLTPYRAVAVVPTVQSSVGYIGDFYPLTNNFSANFVNNQTKRIGFITTYTFKTNITIQPNASGHILLGSTLAESLTNLMRCVNGDPSGAGVIFTRVTTNAWPSGKSPNPDMKGWLGTNLASIVLTNRMDGANSTGTNQYGWPSAMQSGLLTMTAMYTNLTSTNMYGCYQWSNTFYFSDAVTAPVTWKLNYTSSALVPNVVTNMLQENRDYFNDIAAPGYTALAYPYPAIATPPTISALTNITLNMSSNSVAQPFTIGDSETLPSNLLLGKDSSDTNIIKLSDVVLGGSDSNRTVTVTAWTNIGSSVITVTVTNENDETAFSQFTVNVVGVPDAPPTISSIPNVVGFVNAVIGPIPFTVGDDVTQPGDLVLTAHSATSLITTNNVVFGGSGGNRTVTVTPTSGMAGQTRLTITVTDGAGLTNSTAPVVSVLPVGTGAFPRFGLE